MDYNILLRLLCAHFICDFMMQSSRWVAQKTSGDTATRVKANALHGLLHAVVAYVFAGMWECWYLPVAILVSHFIADFWVKGTKKGLMSFVMDQLIHIAVLVVVWLYCTNQFEAIGIRIDGLTESNRFWMLIIAYVLILKPASILVSLFIQKWSSQLKSGAISLQEKGLTDAGLWIGYIERFLIVTFIITGNFGIIGFLLTAKSIFRYGNLKELNDVKMTEYVLIGTLSSFSIAIIVGLILGYCVL